MNRLGRYIPRGASWLVWRHLFAAAVVLALPACSAVPQRPHSHAEPIESPLPSHHGVPCPDCGPALPTAGGTLPLPDGIITPWRPPGIAGPWPADEYLCDGGDRDVQVTVAKDWQIGGLETEDTVVHYDTIDGRRVVEPSNKVCIYAPRFGAVRKVEGARQDQQNDAVVQAHMPQKLNQHDDLAPPTAVTQPVAPRGQALAREAGIARLKQAEGRLANERQIAAVQDRLLPFGDLQVIRQGTFDHSEKAILAIGVDAAIVWSHEKGAQVVLDGRPAHTLIGDARAQATFGTDVPNSPRLRVIKIASTNTALPGETVEFTLRFDNVGDQTIGNVTVVDNLTTRLEYIAGTAQSSRKAEFSTQQNDGDSLVMRWELADPLKTGEGGVIRFHCKVR